MKKTITLISVLLFALVMSAGLWAHHMAPDELQDFITDQLTTVDSPHLLSSDEDPSLLDTVIPGMTEIDYVLIYYDLTIEQALELISITSALLESDTTVEEFSWTLLYQGGSLYTLTFYINYK